jgi:hypothetical protein
LLTVTGFAIAVRMRAIAATGRFTLKIARQVHGANPPSVGPTAVRPP